MVVDRGGSHSPFAGERLLDVGCGNGSYTTVLGRHFIESERLDAFREHLADSASADGFHLAEMSAEELQFDAGFFDVVTAIEVIEHIVDDSRAAGEIFRVLKPGGAFLITAPNRWFPIETHSFMIAGKERKSKGWPFVPWLKPLHKRISTARNYRKADLDRLLVPHGFELVGIDYLMPPLERARVGRFVRPISDAMGETRLRTFDASIIAAYRKPTEGEAPS